MRRSGLTAAVLAIAALWLPATATAYHPVVETKPWSLQRVSPSGRTLVVAVSGGGCWLTSSRRATVIRQDKHVVELRVEMTRFIPDGQYEGCAMNGIAGLPVFVGLASPLKGRALHFPTYSSQPVYRRVPPWLPRMVGVRGRDAVRALADQGILARITGPADGVVVRQEVVRQDVVTRTGGPKVNWVALVTHAKPS